MDGPYSEEDDIYDDEYDESTEGPSVIDPWTGLTQVNNSILYLVFALRKGFSNLGCANKKT